MAYNDDNLCSKNGAAVTPHDSNDLAVYARALYIGTGGGLKVITVGGSTLDFANLPSGFILPVSCKRVHATGQTGTIAANIVALY